MLMHAAFSLLLSRHSNQDDIVIGTAVANRLQKEVEPMIGFFVNTLVLRSQGEDLQSFPAYLQHIKQVNLEAQAHQDIPFEQLVEHLNTPRSTRHTPLFQIMLTLSDNEQDTLTLEGMDFTPMPPETAQAKFDLELDVQIDRDGIRLNWLYDKGLFKRQSIVRLNQHLQTLLSGIATAPQSQLKDLPMLDEQEIHYLRHELNQTLSLIHI